MRSVKLRWLAMCGLFVLGAVVVVPLTQANPPFANATYTGVTSQGLAIVLIVNEAGNGLAEGSYVDFQCGDNPVARQFLVGTSTHIPSGVTNRSGEGITNADGMITTLGFAGGTLSWRFFGRFFTQAGAAPGGGGGGGTFPTGPPPPGTPPPQFTQPPGEVATGDFSGRNNTGIPGGEGFCSFRATWNAATPIPPA